MLPCTWLEARARVKFSAQIDVNFLFKIFNVIEFARFFYGNVPIQNIHKGFPFILHIEHIHTRAKSFLLSLFPPQYRPTIYSSTSKRKLYKDDDNLRQHQMNSFTWQPLMRWLGWGGTEGSWKIQVSSNKLLQLLHSINEALKFVELHLPCTPPLWSWSIHSSLLHGIMCVLCAWHGDSRHGQKK